MPQSGEETIRRARKHILVIKGGTSLEHDVSMNSGAQIAANLDRTKYHLHPVTITRTGEWIFDEEPDSAGYRSEGTPNWWEAHDEQ